MPEAATDRAGRRPNQKRRTRKDLLQAAARLMKAGRRPTLDEIAEEALVSRATAYRYFPGLDALLLEASLDVAAPEAEALFGPGAPADPAARVLKVDEAFDAMIRANEPALRMMVASALERIAKGETEPGVPARQNRRSPLIEAALEPARASLDPGRAGLLAKALAMLIGTEGMIVARDVLQLDEAEARRVKRWAIEALVAAAR
jgi:AcrR family transcriptional regulator